MGWKEFAASVIGDVLSWPVVFLVAVLLVLKPLRRLIGRIRSFKGWGADVQLAEELKKIEENAVDAVDDVAEEQADATHPDVAAEVTADADAGGNVAGQQDESDGAPHKNTFDDVPSSGRVRNRVRLAALKRYLEPLPEGSIFDPPAHALEDPSGAVISAWESLLEMLRELNKATRGPGRPTSNPRLIIGQLARDGVVSDSFVDTVEGLLKVRNEVAHGVTAPSRNAARTYWRTAEQMRSLAASILDERRGPAEEPAAEE